MKVNLIEIDTEYKPITDQPTLPVSLQIRLTNTNRNINRYFIILDNRYIQVKPKLPEILEDLKLVDDKFYNCDVIFDDLDNFRFEDFLTKYNFKLMNNDNNQLHFYYAEKDLEIFFGKQRFRELVLNETFTKIRKISGLYKDEDTKQTLKLIDQFALHNSSLEQALTMNGIDTQFKGLELDKSQMDKELLENTSNFLLYALNDLSLLDLMDKKVHMVNSITQDTFGFFLFKSHANDGFTVDGLKNIPLSVGSLIAQVFEEYIKKSNTSLYFASLYATKLKDMDSRDELITAVRNENKKLVKRILNKNDIVHGLAAGSINSFVYEGQYLHENVQLNALVQGGRCFNEYPRWNVHDNFIYECIDVDLSSCYGSALNRYDFPIGMPCSGGFSIVDKFTLENFLDKYRHEFVDGLWQVVVTGKLKFKQDLIPSKFGITPSKIKKISLDDDENFLNEKLNANFEIFQYEIINGIITQDVLDIIENVSSNQEKKGFFNLNVVAYSLYKKSDYIDPLKYKKTMDGINNTKFITVNRRKYKNGGVFVEEEKFLSDTGEECKKTSIVDTRSYKWTSIPLSSYIQPLITYRKELKNQKVKKGDKFDLLQNGVKLFINTLYGDFAAVYFNIGNSILANNITASARVGVWMMSKALMTVQSITDGGLCSNLTIPRLKNKSKLPSIQVMSDRKTYMKHSTVVIDKLIDTDNIVDWMDENGGIIDEILLTHVKSFWEKYKLDFKFDIECKRENTGCKAVYYSKSDYLINTASSLDENPIYTKPKVRGAKNNNHPRVKWLFHLMDPKVYPKPDKTQEVIKKVGFSMYKQAVKQGSKNVFDYDKLSISDRFTTTTDHNPRQATPYLDFDDYKKRLRNYNNAKKSPKYQAEDYHFDAKKCC